MWTSIKEIFTKSSEIRKLKEEIQSKEDSSQKTTQLLSDTEKIKDKIIIKRNFANHYLI